MSILVIRTHQRFAVRHSARIRNEVERPLDGLLIELSLSGCRISNVDHREFKVNQLATVLLNGFEEIVGQVRWAHDGLVGLRFTRPLHAATLDTMVKTFRNQAGSDGAEMCAYGT
jgi:hypothetical protein